MTTKTAPGGSTKRKTTGILANSRGQAGESNRDTGIIAILIQIITSNLTASPEQT
jgi:hypothetical protein